MLDFTAAHFVEPPANDGIVRTEHLHSGFVAHFPSERSGSDNVGKQDCPNRGVSCIRLRTLQHNRAARIQFAAAHEQIGNVWFDLNDFLRYQAMRFAMDGFRGFRAGCVTKAKSLLGFFVNPILMIADAVLFLDGKVLGMGLGHFFGRDDAARKFVNVHVIRHKQPYDAFAAFALGGFELLRPRSAWSSNAAGAPNIAMMPSPVNLSTVPP